TGTAPLTYQWQKNNVNITGAVSPMYTTPATILSDSGSTYRVIVTNSAGSTTSNAATLTVNPATAINLIINPGFESGTASWLFYTNGVGTFSPFSPGYGGSSNAAKLAFISIGTSMQLYQTGVTLEPNTRYRLSFAAYSTKGHDLKVNLIKHVAPFTNYGLYQPINLGTSWQSFTIEFTTSGFVGTVRDGRLQFWFAGTGFAAAGDIYYIDDVRLEKVISATVPPTITTQPSSQSVNAGQIASFSVVATGTAP
ncbi:MAG: Carbohydrate binding domain protein, partial [Candidatus Methanoperedens nitroreducens]